MDMALDASDNLATEYPWTTVFLEVALRAVRRVHLEYGIWGAGQQWRTTAERVRRINAGPGIELADERAVCAAIVQEMMMSQSVVGFWGEEEVAEAAPRVFSILREQNYTRSEDKVDLLMEKYEQQPNGKFEVKKPRSWIEAKRARLWRVDDWRNTNITSGPRQIASIAKDIAKLRAECKNRKEGILIHVLVWGVYETKANAGIGSDDPEDFFAALRTKVKKLEKPSVRWMPTSWQVTSKGLRVTRAVWIALSEIDKP